MGGGIIIQRNAVLLVAITDHCIYNTLSAAEKAVVDDIDAKEPASRTQADINTLYGILGVVKGC